MTPISIANDDLQGRTLQDAGDEWLSQAVHSHN